MAQSHAGQRGRVTEPRLGLSPLESRGGHPSWWHKGASICSAAQLSLEWSLDAMLFTCCLWPPPQPWQPPGLRSGFASPRYNQSSLTPACCGPSPVPEFRNLEKNKKVQALSYSPGCGRQSRCANGAGVTQAEMGGAGGPDWGGGSGHGASGKRALTDTWEWSWSSVGELQQTLGRWKRPFMALDCQ